MANKRIWSVLAVLVLAGVAMAQEDTVPGSPGGVGVNERLGEFVPINELTFTDEQGKEVTFSQYFDRPIVFIPVYYRCPGICTPVLQEVASVMGKTDLTPGEDYRVLTVSFEPKETHDLAQLKKTNMIAEVKNKEVPEDAWRFFVGDAENVSRLTSSVGFLYQRDANGVDYVHTGTVVFLSKDGKIVRYLDGVRMNPADFKMAVLDAQKGFPRSVIQTVQKLCYTFNPDSRTYVLQVNRIILGVTMVFVLGFGGFLFIKSSSKPGGGGETPGNLPPTGELS